MPEIQHGRDRTGSGPDDHDFRSITWRWGNALAGLFARAGIGPIQLLTTHGRRTGRTYERPVVPITHADREWLVAPYGEVAWVRNVRVDGRVTLRHGPAIRRCTTREASLAEAAPVLKKYVATATKTAGRFRATPSSPVEHFEQDARRMPVFELTEDSTECS